VAGKTDSFSDLYAVADVVSQFDETHITKLVVSVIVAPIYRRPLHPCCAVTLPDKQQMIVVKMTLNAASRVILSDSAALADRGKQSLQTKSQRISMRGELTRLTFLTPALVITPVRFCVRDVRRFGLEPLGIMRTRRAGVSSVLSHRLTPPLPIAQVAGASPQPAGQTPFCCIVGGRICAISPLAEICGRILGNVAPAGLFSLLASCYPFVVRYVTHLVTINQYPIMDYLSSPGPRFFWTL